MEAIYLIVAKKYKIFDKPNVRSSHSHSTIRGGGIIFPLAYLIFLPFDSYVGFLPFSIGVFLISIVSFMDDIYKTNSSLRFFIHSLSVAIVVLPLENTLGWYQLLLICIVLVSIINAYNFMDGINGITAFYSLVTMGSFLWINYFVVQLLPEQFYVWQLAAILVFSFFNFRVNAYCFAGDVGSVSMAFIICFLLIRLFVQTGSVSWILLLSVYGIDTGFTILCRVVRHENIFTAHRSHFYQFLVNEAGINSLVISVLYGCVQCLLNVIVILSYNAMIPELGTLAMVIILMIYIIFRFHFEGPRRLFVVY